VFDAQGSGHDLQVSFLKVGGNTWAIEIFARPPTDVTVTGPLVDGQIATGEVTFNGDGSLASVATTLSSPSPIVWTTGSSASTISFDFGTAGPIGTGLTDGLSQFAGGFNVAFVNQNGSEVGQLNGISINEEGFVIASFSNGETQRVFKLPIATFADVSKLEARTGNVYARTQA
jgi:flagellar hook protein FlgE